MFRQLPLAAAVTVINATLMTLVLHRAERSGRPWAWLTAILLVTALRLLAWQAWRRGGAPGRRLGPCRHLRGGLRRPALGRRRRLAVAGLRGLPAVLGLLVGGMCVGAAAVHAAHHASALAFILPAALPLAARFGLAGTERGFAAAAMILVLLAALVALSRHSSAYFGINVRLRLDLAQQAQSLDAANASLRTEIANHRATEASLRHAQKMEALGQAILACLDRHRAACKAEAGPPGLTASA